MSASSVSKLLLLLLKRLLESESRWADRPGEDLMALSVLLLLLTGRTMSLEEEEEVRGVFGSDGFLLRDETLAGGFLSSVLSFP